MDESGFSLKTPLTRCWMKCGVQTRLLAPYTRAACVVAGVIDWMSEQVWCRPLERLCSEALIGYFEWLFETVYPTQPLVLVMDNAAFHRSQTLQAFLSLYQHRVLVVWLPPYSPDMNLIERFWKHLKLRGTANRLFQSLDHLETTLFDELVRQNSPDYLWRFSFLKNL